MNINKEAESLNDTQKINSALEAIIGKRKWPVDYRDPAIFVECVKWLLDNRYILDKEWAEGIYIVWHPNRSATYSRDLFEAVALARIGADKQ